MLTHRAEPSVHCMLVIYGNYARLQVMLCEIVCRWRRLANHIGGGLGPSPGADHPHIWTGAKRTAGAQAAVLVVFLSVGEISGSCDNLVSTSTIIATE